MNQSAIGIDLGTTFSAVAVINPSGKPEIVPNRDGERTTASVVLISSDGTALVGEHARAAAAAEPERVISEVKRSMGKPDHRFKIDGRSLSPAEVSSLILKQVREDSEKVLGSIRHAVITVPAYFDEIRRKATMDAGRMAGLDVLRIINEPTAAALAYAVGGRVSGKVLVYDFGGGTFDVSVVQINSPQDIQVLSSEGDHQLGGKDLDRLLAKHFSDLFKAQHKIPLEGDAGVEYRTMEEAEKAKRRLSTMNAVSGIPLTHKGLYLAASIDRPTYEKLIQEYIVRTEMLVDDALMAAGLKPHNIDAVLLVGGSSRTPAVQTMLRRKFGKDPQMSINPDEAVALGAAVQAGILMQQRGSTVVQGAAGEALRRTKIQDVSPHSYGTISLGEAYGTVSLRNTIIIPKNTPVPCSKTVPFCTPVDNQTVISCKVTQGEDEDPEFVKVVYEATLELPPNRPAGREVRVTFSYDANQRMMCEFLDVESKRSRSINLDIANTDEGGGKEKLMDEDFDTLVID